MSNTYLGPDNIDDLGRMVTALLTELWITRDRVAVLERMLEDKGMLLPGEANDYIPDAGFEAELETLRDRMAGNVIGAPLAARERSVDQILARAGMKRPDSMDRTA
ncbi:hypothetical protein LWE61_06750 [Sphingobium sufflavum]|uniref:hypothetical protein n=1 Tax=Sphingobium sufflavum TaxID=1129547 RepID=UPI001F249797|nr:hypothetical protein [Sphingobium sufflavum]MCE7796259.1 hypothetical protein [Sphingobium sufflavum]